MVHEIFKKDGKRILIEQYLNFINRKDKIAGFQGFRSDITGRDITEEQLKSSFINLAKIVSHVIEFCDPYTATHQQRVAELACLVGENMGLADDVVERLYFNGLLHDIGKISIPKSILTKPGELAEEEWALIRAHTKQGYSILKDANLPWPAAEAALQHHERLDGSGYPNGITGDKLSLEVSILAVCDVVEAMSSHRPYRPARTTTDVLKELTDGRGTKYSATVVDVMLPKIESGEFRSMWNCINSRSTAT
jgi:HD-GYP domain-containing protein (c-di-GMP phosphodiesterase class II)